MQAGAEFGVQKFLRSLALLACSTLAASSFASELFPDRQTGSYTPGAELPAASTVGGHAVYQGNDSWQLVGLTTQKTGTSGMATPLTLGVVKLVQGTPAEGWAAAMYIVVSLNSVGPRQYMTGAPCAGSHLITVNKGFGLEDNCLTVDADRPTGVANGPTILTLKIYIAKSAGRLYVIDLNMNPAVLGFADTEPADWTPAAVKAAPERAAFVQRLQKWAEALQDSSDRALDFSKPQDAFANVPSFRTLSLAAKP